MNIVPINFNQKNSSRQTFCSGDYVNKTGRLMQSMSFSLSQYDQIKVMSDWTKRLLGGEFKKIDKIRQVLINKAGDVMSYNIGRNNQPAWVKLGKQDEYIIIYSDFAEKGPQGIFNSLVDVYKRVMEKGRI